MDILRKAQFIQQCYKLVTLSHMASKAFQIIYQNNLYGLVSNTDQSAMSSEYESKIVECLSDLTVSISDMCSCVLHDNSTGFEKIFEAVNANSTAMITMFNELNDAAERKSSSGDSDSAPDDFSENQGPELGV